MRRATVLALSGAALACAAAGAGGSRLSGPGAIREDRVVISQFRDVIGVAVSRRYVYAASPGLLAIYDRTFDRWRTPVAASADLPLGRITAMAGDPSSDAVWVGGQGVLSYYQPDVDYATRALLPGVVQRIAFDRRSLGSGALVLTTGGWFRVSSSGLATSIDPSGLPRGAELVVAPTLEEIYREFPILQNAGAVFTRDASLRNFQVVAAAKSPDRASEVWLGTLGGGLLKADPVFQQSTRVPYGLQDPGVGALSRAADGVWVGGLGLVQASGGYGAGASAGDAYGGLTFVDDALQEFRQLAAVRGAGVDDALRGARVFDLQVREGAAWAATDRGLARVGTRDGSTQIWDGLRGLPADQALSVLARAEGTWVGSARGLSIVHDGSGGPRAQDVESRGFAGTPVWGLYGSGNAIWAATEAGLALFRSSADTVAVRPASAVDPRLRGPIRAIAGSDTELVVAAQGALFRLDARDGRELPRLPGLDALSIGTLVRLAMDERTIWVAGSLGVLAVSRTTGASRFLSVPRDLPAEPYAIALGPDFAWVGTRAGLVRFRRFTDGLVR